MKRRFAGAGATRAAMAVLLVVLASTGFRVLPAAAADQVTFILDWIPYGSHTGFFAALNKGIFKDAGLDVTIRRGYGSGDTSKLVSTKKGDFGFADTGTLVVAIAKGAEAKSIGVLYNKAPHTAFALRSSGIRKIRDLEGRSIGDTQAGAAYTVFPAVAKVNGVKDWKFVPMSPASKNPALLAGKVDVIVTFADLGPALRSGAEKINDGIVELRYADNGVDFYGNGVIAHNDTLKSRADLARRFVNAVFKGVAFAVKNPDEGAALFVKSNPNSKQEIIRAQWDVLVSLAWTGETQANGLGYMGREKMQKTIDLMHTYRNLERKPSLAEVYDPGFLEKITP